MWLALQFTLLFFFVPTNINRFNFLFVKILRKGLQDQFYCRSNLTGTRQMLLSSCYTVCYDHHFVPQPHCMENFICFSIYMCSKKIPLRTRQNCWNLSYSASVIASIKAEFLKWKRIRLWEGEIWLKIVE